MRRLSLVLAGLPLLAADYSIAPGPGSHFKLEVHKTGLLSGKVHVFTYEKYSGTLKYDPARPEQTQVDFRIEANSAVCQDTWIGDKDKRKVTEMALETMEANKHPHLQFRSTSVAKRESGKFEVQGVLTIKGISKPVSVSVSVHPQDGGLRIEGVSKVIRKDFKIDPRAAIPFGLVGNKEEMPVSFTLLAKPSP
jgi:polyisoprenoid-binding protein YceI